MNSYPFPSVARLALAFLVSVKRIDRVAPVVEVQPWEKAAFVDVPQHLRNTRAFKLSARSEGI